MREGGAHLRRMDGCWRRGRCYIAQESRGTGRRGEGGGMGGHGLWRDGGAWPGRGKLVERWTDLWFVWRRAAVEDEGVDLEVLSWRRWRRNGPEGTNGGKETNVSHGPTVPSPCPVTEGCFWSSPVPPAPLSHAGLPDPSCRPARGSPHTCPRFPSRFLLTPLTCPPQSPAVAGAPRRYAYTVSHVAWPSPTPVCALGTAAAAYQAPPSSARRPQSSTCITSARAPHDIMGGIRAAPRARAAPALLPPH